VVLITGPSYTVQKQAVPAEGMDRKGSHKICGDGKRQITIAESPAVDWKIYRQKCTLPQNAGT
jgi:hypothetical protein